MDIGLRNLDISLGLSDRALMDFTDVAEGRCPLDRAAVTHPDLPGPAPAHRPHDPPPGPLTEEAVRRMLDTARAQYDYILMDSPAGLGAGFRLACCAADRAIVVSTNDASALRDAQRTVRCAGPLRQIHLVMNRVQPKLLRQLRTTIDDAMDAAGLPLLGVVPEDPQVMLSANQGQPLILGGRQGRGHRLSEYCQASGGAPGPHHAHPLNPFRHLYKGGLPHHEYRPDEPRP